MLGVKLGENRVTQWAQPWLFFNIFSNERSDWPILFSVTNHKARHENCFVSSSAQRPDIDIFRHPFLRGHNNNVTFVFAKYR